MQARLGRPWLRIIDPHRFARETTGGDVLIGMQDGRPEDRPSGT